MPVLPLAGLSTIDSIYDSGEDLWQAPAGGSVRTGCADSPRPNAEFRG